MKTTNKILITMIAVFAMTGIAGGHLNAQQNDFTATRNAIERTDEVLKEAEAIIAGSRSNIARHSLERAVTIQERAKSFFAADRNQFAYKYTMEARREAWHAIALARSEARIEDKMQNMSELATERLQRLRERVVENDIRDQRLDRLMNEARSQMEKARMNAQQLKNQLAVNLAESAIKLTRQAENRFRRLLDLKEISERRLQLMERLMERARDRIESAGSDADRLQYQKAGQEMNRARELVTEGEYRQARIAIENCERILRGLARKIAGEAGGDGGMMLDEALRLQERAAEMIFRGEDPPQAAVALYERARIMLQEARADFEGDAGRAGSGKIEQARRLLRQAIEKASPEEGAGEVEDELDRMIRMRESLREAVADCKAAGAVSLYERANVRLEKAIDHFERGRIQEASAEARIARNIFQRIREICQN